MMELYEVERDFVESWHVLRLTHDMTTMTTPTTKGCSDVSIILPEWCVTLVGPGQCPRITSAVKKHTGTRSTPKLFHRGSGATVERDRVMCLQVVQVWLLSSQCGSLCETQLRLSRRTSEPRQSQRRGTGTQIHEQTTSTVKKIPQEIDVEKRTDEDVDEMILETDLDDDAQQNESESDAVTDRHGVFRRRLHRDSGGGTAQDQDYCKVHGGW